MGMVSPQLHQHGRFWMEFQDFPPDLGSWLAAAQDPSRILHLQVAGKQDAPGLGLAGTQPWLPPRQGLRFPAASNFHEKPHQRSQNTLAETVQF